MTDSFEFLPQYSGWLIAILAGSVALGYLAVRFGAGPAMSLARNWKLAALRVALIAALLAVLANPVRVSSSGGSIVPADVFMLADASASMALDDADAPRWSKAIEFMRQSIANGDQFQANVKLFKFGRQLEVLSRSEVLADQKPDAAREQDTQLLAALRQMTTRFGQRLPAGVVVLSDGRARDAGAVSDVASHYRHLGVPIHVVPLGSTAASGDFSVLSLVAPSTIRKHSDVDVDIFIRSYGFTNKTAQLELVSVEPDGGAVKKLAATPVVLTDGFQAVTMSFHSDESMHTLRARIAPMPKEMSAENNFSDATVEVDRSKLRVLYLEGGSFALRAEVRNSRVVMIGPHTPLQEALQEDPDVECRVLLLNSGTLTTDGGLAGAFPRTATELYSYDAVIFSNVPRQVLTDEQLSWLQHWVEMRGAGLCMVGGAQSFGDGGWSGSNVGKMLPVDSPEQNSWRDDLTVASQPVLGDPPHPIFRLVEDRQRNAELLQAMPPVRGSHSGWTVRPAVGTVLATGTPAEQSGDGFFSGTLGRALQGDTSAKDADAAQPVPTIVAGRYGRGRTLAMTFPITAPAAAQWQNWGGTPEHYGRFWRNVAYWLTNGSFIGRRRLTATADKHYFQPGETIKLSAEAYDDGARQTNEYRLVAAVEPQSLDVDSDYAPFRWPSGVKRTSGEQSSLAMWGEEFEIPAITSADGRVRYALDLELAEAPAVGRSSGARLEITAYDNGAQVDSTTLPIQVLHDPFEQQSPFPDHELLRKLAAGSGGSIIQDANELAALLRNVPTIAKPRETHKSPAWSSWGVLVGLLGLVTAEWCLRRHAGLG
jgi:hypothetical protein